MKNKGLLIAVIILFVLAVASAGAFFFTNGKAPSSPAQTSAPKQWSFESSDYSADASGKALDKIYMPTDIDGVYYSADLSGNFEFFTYSAGTFTSFPGEVKAVETSVSVSRQTIPATVYCIGANNRICGYGLFTADKSDSPSPVYPYAFFKVTQKPAAYGDGFLLLVDFEKENFYKADKIYSDIFTFSLETGKASYMTNQITRMIDRNGAYRNDWNMMTDYFLNNMGNTACFLSSRYYNLDQRGVTTDVMVMSGAYKPVIRANAVTGLWVYGEGDTLHYLRNTPTGFSSIALTDSEKVVAEFDGSFFGDYLLSGNTVINKNTLVMTNLLTGESKTLSNIIINDATVFSLSPDGRYAVFASPATENSTGAKVQKVTYCAVDGSNVSSFSEPLLYSESASFVWVDNINVMSVRATDGTGNTCTGYIRNMASQAQ